MDELFGLPKKQTTNACVDDRLGCALLAIAMICLKFVVLLLVFFLENQNLYVGSAVNGWHDIFGNYKTGLAAEPGRKVFLVLVTQQAYDVGNEIQQIVNSLGTEIYGGIGKLKHLLQITLHKQYHKTQKLQQNNMKKY